ncbi:MAG: hypothetical protein C0404_10400 [Verrucomicrobia bacterium]|nr:hypothetical protein [Verrucomicrobiota bacterium]
MPEWSMDGKGPQGLGLSEYGDRRDIRMTGGRQSLGAVASMNFAVLGSVSCLLLRVVAVFCGLSARAVNVQR